MLHKVAKFHVPYWALYPRVVSLGCFVVVRAAMLRADVADSEGEILTSFTTEAKLPLTSACLLLPLNELHCSPKHMTGCVCVRLSGAQGAPVYILDLQFPVELTVPFYTGVPSGQTICRQDCTGLFLPVFFFFYPTMAQNGLFQL